MAKCDNFVITVMDVVLVNIACLLLLKAKIISRTDLITYYTVDGVADSVDLWYCLVNVLLACHDINTTKSKCYG